MSRNLANGANCKYCPGVIVTLESPRIFSVSDHPKLYVEFNKCLVAKAHCTACLAKYLAWVKSDGTIYDLSFRSTVNDEPGEDDLPRYTVKTVLVRTGVFTDSPYFRLGKVEYE